MKQPLPLGPLRFVDFPEGSRRLDIPAARIIIGRMINNGEQPGSGPEKRRGTRVLLLALACAAALAAGCDRAEAPKTEEVYQGVAELDDRRLSFELAGRITAVNAREGDRVAGGTVMATLDGALDAQARATRDLE